MPTVLFVSLMCFVTPALAENDPGILTPEVVALPTSMPTTPAPEDVLPLLKETVKAARAAKWALMIGMLMMILTAVFNIALKDRLNRKLLPWIAMALGVATQLSLSLSTGADIVDAIFAGIQAGLTAAGGYSAFGRYLPVIRKGPGAS